MSENFVTGNPLLIKTGQERMVRLSQLIERMGYSNRKKNTLRANPAKQGQGTGVRIRKGLRKLNNRRLEKRRLVLRIEGSEFGANNMKL